jgi:hypothetical protein
VPGNAVSEAEDLRTPDERAADIRRLRKFLGLGSDERLEELGEEPVVIPPPPPPPPHQVVQSGVKFPCVPVANKVEAAPAPAGAQSLHQALRDNPSAVLTAALRAIFNSDLAVRHHRGRFGYLQEAVNRTMSKLTREPEIVQVSSGAWVFPKRADVAGEGD